MLRISLKLDGWMRGAAPVYPVAIVGLIWLQFPFKQSPEELTEDELLVVVKAATTRGKGW
jgi:hypothetical protein